MLWVCWIALFGSSVAIAYQDLKSRLISVWLILCFAAANITQFLLQHSAYLLLENTLFCLAYFLFSFLIIHLFYFFKTGKFQKVLDEKIGWGDVWLFLFTGCCLGPVELIWFFTVTCIVAVAVQVLFVKRAKTVALAGVLVICYVVLMSYLLLTGASSSF